MKEVLAKAESKMGGVDGTEWCTTVEKTFIINGDMYEDAYTTSTY